jgi:hypothetical protein
VVTPTLGLVPSALSVALGLLLNVIVFQDISKALVVPTSGGTMGDDAHIEWRYLLEVMLYKGAGEEEEVGGFGVGVEGVGPLSLLLGVGLRTLLCWPKDFLFLYI